GPEPTGAMGPTLEALAEVGGASATHATTAPADGDTIPVRLLDPSRSRLSEPASRVGLDDPGQEAAGDDGEVDKRRHRLQQAMTSGAGVVRSKESLAVAQAVVEEVAGPGRGP